jgi:hypothetical protein
MTDPQVKVLFIGGYGRSGSTLLDMMLGQVPGFFSAGELRHVWVRGFRENHLCSCGLAFRECALWREVVREAFGGHGAADLEKTIAAQYSVDRMRNIYRLARGGGSQAFNDTRAAYGRQLARLYAAIRKVTGCTVIVDSSKAPAHGFLLKGLPDVDLRTVLLIRDSRAAAFSWMRRKPRPEIRGRDEMMPRHSPVTSALLWNARNHFVELLGRAGSPLLNVRYEDLAAAPERLLKDIVAFASPPAPPAFEFLAGHTLAARVLHQIAGNPLRFHEGRLDIRADEEWRTKMSAPARLAVTALTLPGLIRHGYVP